MFVASSRVGISILQNSGTHSWSILLASLWGFTIVSLIITDLVKPICERRSPQCCLPMLLLVLLSAITVTCIESFASNY
jgi:hypothetical protein